VEFYVKGIDEVLKESKQNAIEFFIEPVFFAIRARKKKKMFNKLADDSSQENFFFLMVFKMLIKLLMQHILGPIKYFLRYPLHQNFVTKKVTFKIVYYFIIFLFSYFIYTSYYIKHTFYTLLYDHFCS